MAGITGLFARGFGATGSGTTGLFARGFILTTAVASVRARLTDLSRALTRVRDLSRAQVRVTAADSEDIVA